jgi:transposase
MNNTVRNSINANDTLPGDIPSLIFALEELKNTVEKQDDTIKKQQHTIELLRKALFGPRSERIVDTDERQGVFDFIQDEVNKMDGSQETDTALENTDGKTSDALSKRRKKRSSLQDLVPEDLPREEVVIDLPENEKSSPDGTALKHIGEERVEKLAYKSGFWFLKVFVYPKYADPNNALSGVKKAPAPDFAIPGGVFDESFLAWIAYDKCSMHLPLYRLEEAMRCAGIKISRQTLSCLYLKTAKILKPLYELMIKDILSRKIIFTDDTSVRMLMPGTGKTKKTYMWVYVGGGGGPPYRVFDFTLERTGDCPKRFLRDFKGYVHADAFNGYDLIFGSDDISECSCWMHVRRNGKFGLMGS